MNNNSSLVWSPTHSYLHDVLSANRTLRLVISPFITLDALKHIVEMADRTAGMQVITRWRGQDLLSGVSDIRIYPYLAGLGIPLFIHSSIHLKLLVFDRSRAFHSSGNITRNGLGLEVKGNVEVGCDVTIKANDWRNIYRILAESTCVDEFVYQQANDYIEAYKTAVDRAPQMILREATDKVFSWLSLPATSNPEQLWHYYSGALSDDEILEIAAPASKDLVAFAIPDGLDKCAFHRTLKEAFIGHAFIIRFVEILAAEGSLRFGYVRKWLQENCSDKPQPYRQDLNQTVRNLYNWLQHYYAEIAWDRPNHSMVIYWTPHYDC